MSIHLRPTFLFMKADILSIAVILGPLAGVAGVFVWGYKPKESKVLTQKGLQQIKSGSSEFRISKK